MIRQACTEVERVDVVILPELALSQALADELATDLARGADAPAMLICGAASADGTRNQAVTFQMDKGKVTATSAQSKHHPWRISGPQIKAYHLGHAFDPSHAYWENIRVHDRSLQFVVNRNSEVIAALVCEDLARTDPILPLLNAVGPSLVVALLMDGPQLVNRWPGRYAMALAEDPGSAVLTITSLGMVARSRAPDKPLPGNGGRRCVALWREPEEAAMEIDLPADAHALVLALTSAPSLQTGLDLRHDRGLGVRLALAAVRPVKVDAEELKILNRVSVAAPGGAHASHPPSPGSGRRSGTRAAPVGAGRARRRLTTST